MRRSLKYEDIYLKEYQGEDDLYEVTSYYCLPYASKDLIKGSTMAHPAKAALLELKLKTKTANAIKVGADHSAEKAGHGTMLNCRSLFWSTSSLQVLERLRS